MNGRPVSLSVGQSFAFRGSAAADPALYSEVQAWHRTKLRGCRSHDQIRGSTLTLVAAATHACVSDFEPTTASYEQQLAAAQSMISHLETALQNSRIIGTALGILIERHKISSEDAFGMLVKVSQSSHRKLHAIAADLVYTGELPGQTA
jgi:ANTAR domain